MARRGRWLANGVGVAIIVVVIVVAFVLSEEVLDRPVPGAVQRYSANCSVAGGNGTGVNSSCELNVTFSSGELGFNWTVKAGNATSVTLTVNSTANNVTRTAWQGGAAHDGGLLLNICNASLPHTNPCQAFPGNFTFDLKTDPGVNGWLTYRLAGYFQAQSQS